MSQSAQQIQVEFARLAGEEAGTVYLEQLLRHGFDAWPDFLKCCYPAIRFWRGVSQLKRELKELVGASSNSHVVTASRSAELMKMAATVAFRRCTNILTTDLSWPNYQRILEHEARRVGGRVTQMPLRKLVLQHGIDCQDLIKRVVRLAEQHRCDGLFLPLVDNLGVRLPVEGIAFAVRQRANMHFIVVDGAQAISHVPFTLADNWCDLFLAGCHKWSRAYNPLGLAFFGNPDSADVIQTHFRQLQANRRIDDPLLRFTTELESGQTTRYGETVNLLPLLTCSAAVYDATSSGQQVGEHCRGRLRNAHRLVQWASGHNWKPLRPAPCLRSGICLLRTGDRRLTQVSPGTIRERLHDAGLAVTTYRGGIVRFSLPAVPWTDEQESVVNAAFERPTPHMTSM